MFRKMLIFILVSLISTLTVSGATSDNPIRILKSVYEETNYDVDLTNQTFYSDVMGIEITPQKSCSQIRVKAVFAITTGSATVNTYARLKLSRNNADVQEKAYGSSTSAASAAHNGTLTFIHVEGGTSGAYSASNELNFVFQAKKSAGNGTIVIRPSQMIIEEYWDPTICSQ